MPRFDAPTEQLRRRTDTSRWEIVTVTFDTADQDTVIPHRLPIADPESVNYQLLRGTAAGYLYHNGAPTRRPWGRGYIIIRASAPMTADIRLSTASEDARTRPLPQSA